MNRDGQIIRQRLTLKAGVLGRVISVTLKATLALTLTEGEVGTISDIDWLGWGLGKGKG